jgi:hypothetical protein
MNKLSKKVDNICEFCNSSFSRNDVLLKHIKTNKKCLNSRPKIDIKCLWCGEIFLTKDKLEKHTSKCGIDKEVFVTSILEKNKALEQQLEDKNKQLEDKDNQIKDLQDKVFKLANKTSNTTYNITLNCDKPLLLSKERVTELMWRYLTIDKMKNGGNGYGHWFLKHVAINDKGKISIECTDKSRKIFKYIDDGDNIITKEGKEIAELIRTCYQESGFLDNSPQGLEYQKYIEEYNDTEGFFKFTVFQKDFINYIAEQTHKKNLTTLF